MESLIARSALHGATTSALSRPTLASSNDPPPAITDWLARLSLLYGVPFEYLVPDYRMLPPESIRWGFLDENWVTRASDGAMAIGRTNTAALSVDQSLAAPTHSALPGARMQVRARLRGVTPPNEGVTSSALTVMLMRSAVVAGYPGMEVRGLRADEDRIELLRMDHLAPDVLIVIFPELPATVELLEPPEGLHFGVRGSASQPTTLLRSLQSATLGQQVMNAGTAVQAQLALRTDSAANVLDMCASRDNIVAQLKQYDGYQGTTLAPADMALEMVRAAGMQRFVAKTNVSVTTGAHT